MATPLTHVGPDGTGRFQRPRSIEEEIDAAALETTNALLERARAGPTGLSSEALLYLIREAQSRGNRRRLNLLLDEWLERCARLLASETPEVREDVIDRVSGWIATRSTRLDFFEVRFGSAMKKERIHSRRIVRLRHCHLDADLPEGPDPSTEEDGIFAERLKAQARAAIRSLPPPLYTTATLVWVFGFSKADAADALGVDEGTVRHRLKRAQETIKDILEKP